MDKKFGIFLVFICTLIVAAGQFFLKKGIETATIDISLIYNINLLLGFILYAIGAGILILALKYGPLSTLYPIISLNFIWVTLISVKIFEENISIIQYLGLGFIFLGVIFLVGEKK